MNDVLKHYELAFIIPGNLAEDEHPAIIAKVKKLLESKNVQGLTEDNLGRRKFAYPIDNLRHGFYFSWEFDLDGGMIKTLEQDLKLTPQILRFLLINKRKKTQEDVEMQEKLKEHRIKKKIAEQAEKQKADEATEMEGKKKISLEDLDKKLDELLGDEMLK